MVVKFSESLGTLSFVKAERKREYTRGWNLCRVEEVSLCRVGAFVELKWFIFVGVVKLIAFNNIWSVSLIFVELGFNVVETIGGKNAADVFILRDWDVSGCREAESKLTCEVCGFGGDSVTEFG